MYRHVVKDLTKINKELCNLNKIPITFEVQQHNSLTVISLMAECKQLLYLGEQRECVRLTELVVRLKKFLDQISFLKSFKSSCENSTKYVQLYITARKGFNNTLPELEKDISMVIEQMQKCVDGLNDTCLTRLTQFNLNKENFEDLVEMFEEIKEKYADYDKHFDGLLKFLEKRKKTPAHIITEEKKLINISLREPTPANEEAMRVSSIKLSEYWRDWHAEQKKLFDGFDMFYSNFMHMHHNFSRFKNLFSFTKVEQLQECMHQLETSEMDFSKFHTFYSILNIVTIF